MTLIDKDAALAVADEVFDLFEKKGDTAGAFVAAEVGERIRALPAVVPGVKSLERAENLRRAIAYAMTELAQSAQDAPAIRAEAALVRAFQADTALVPQPPLELVQKLHELPAHEPRDVRAAALREAAQVLLGIMQALQRTMTQAGYNQNAQIACDAIGAALFSVESLIDKESSQ